MGQALSVCHAGTRGETDRDGQGEYRGSLTASHVHLERLITSSGQRHSTMQG